MRLHMSSFGRFVGLIICVALTFTSELTSQNDKRSAIVNAAKHDRDSPRGQSDWFLVGRRYPPASKPIRALVEKSSAAAKLRQAFAESTRVRSTRAEFVEPTWTELGPRPQMGSNWGRVSGRVTSLAIDPSDKTGDTLYVGTAFGGLWLCSNAQSASPTCVPKSDDRVTLSIGSIAVIAQKGATVVYIGTGEPNNSADSYYGEGIMRSPDGGKTWENPVYMDKDGHDFSGASVSKILIDPDDPNTMLAAVTSANLADGRDVTLGLYESGNAGQSWSLSMPDGGVSDLIYEPHRKTYFAGVVGKGIYKRKRGDRGWTSVASPFQCTSSITDTNFSRVSLATRNGVLWALISNNAGQLSQPSDDDFGLVQSDDGGDHWNPVSTPDTLFQGQGYYDQFVAAPPNSSELVLGGIDVWSTEDIHGTTTEWTNRTMAYASDAVHPDQHAIAFIDNRRWYVGNDGGLWSTVNAGGNWNNLNSSIGAIQFVSVTPDPNNPGAYFGGSQDNDTAYSSPATSFQWISTLDGDGGYTGVDVKHHYFTEQYNVSLYYSDSSSGQWKPVVDGRTINERQAFYVPYTILEGDETKVAMGTSRVWVGPGTPKCAGEGWKPVSGDLTLGEPGYITSLLAIPHTSRVIVTTSDSLIQETDDVLAPQPVWTMISDKSLPTGRTYSSVAVSPTDPQTIYVGVMGFATGYSGSGTGHVFKRVNVNNKFVWINITGNLKDVPVNAILIDPSNPKDIYVATDAEVWLTTDGGTENSVWIPYGQGLPHSAVLQLKMSTEVKRMIVAATHGRGAWSVPPRQ